MGGRGSGRPRHFGPKRCNRCGEVKELSEFYPTTPAKGYYRTVCKACLRRIKLYR